MIEDVKKTKYTIDNTTWQKLNGQYFTENVVADFMCKIGLWSYLVRNIKKWSKIDDLPLSNLYKMIFYEEPSAFSDGISENLLKLLLKVKIYDPAVGDGIFLVKMLKHISSIMSMLNPSQHTISIRERIIESSLFGGDIDLVSVEKCRNKLKSFISKDSGVLNENIKHGDSLFQLKYFNMFDIVICNPPYVRPETLPEEYKDKLCEKYPSFKRSSDLYVYFFPHIHSCLKEHGVCVIITPLSWMDVNYGIPLKAFILMNMPIKGVFYSDTEKWFNDASVNTCISVLYKNGTHKEGAFVAFKKPLWPLFSSNEDYSLSAIKSLIEPDGASEIHLQTNQETSPLLSNIGTFENDGFKAVKVRLDSLQSSSMENKDNSYSIKWTKYLRAPASYYTLQRHLEEKGAYLGDISSITRGFTTGCNEFFYVKESSLSQMNDLLQRDDNGCTKIVHRSSNGKWVESYIEKPFLQPLVKTPRELQTYIVNRESLSYSVLMVDIDKKEELDGLEVLKYIETGESRGFHLRNTCRKRRFWFQLPHLPPSDILLRQFYDVRYNLPLNNIHFPVDHTFYYITNCSNPRLLAAILNSTICYFFIELEGRINQADGVLTCYGPEFRRLRIPLPEAFNPDIAHKLLNLFDQMCKRRALPIFDEIKCEDRVGLDDLVLQAIGFVKEQCRKKFLQTLYGDISKLVKNRIDRGRQK